MRFKVILLDFDGVIVESVGIKDQAMRALFQDVPEHLNQIMDYHLAHNATIRFEKFKYITERILQKPYPKEEEARLSKRFSELVFQKIVACPFVEGSLDFLRFYV